MKKISLLEFVLLFAMALSACGQPPTSSPVPTPVSTEEDILSQQIRLIAESSDLWQADDEMDWWGYAVTDLDQNGRLELISSETHGTGMFTTTRIWEVSEDMASLLPCETDEHCGPIFEARSEMDTKSYIIPTYYDAATGKYWYILDGFVKDGAFRHYEDKRTISLSHGAFSGSFLAFRETLWDESGEHISCRDGDENIITEDDYEHIADQYFQNHEGGTTTIKWVQFIHLSDMTHEGLMDSLNDSFQAFSIALGTEGLEVSYSEVLQGSGTFMRSSPNKFWTFLPSEEQ